MWCFDARHGNWVHYPFEHDPFEETAGALGVGGQFAVGIVKTVENAVSFIIFSGIDNQFHTPTSPSLYETALNLNLKGGSVFAYVHDDNQAWGYNVETGLGSVIPLDHDNTSLRCSGENFLSFARHEFASDLMTLYFYNGTTNDWSTVETWKSTSPDISGGNHVYAVGNYREDVEVEAIFYSPLRDALMVHDYGYHWYLSRHFSDYLVVVDNNQGESSLYDAASGIRHDANYEFRSDGASVGKYVCVGRNADAFMAFGYSGLSRNWTTLVMDEIPQLGNTTEYFGWVTNQDFSKYQAFNCFHDCWVELNPIGSSLGYRVGGKTMIVLRSNILYAFDPEASLTGVQNDEDRANANGPEFTRRSYTLHPNQPNPFNPCTYLSFDLPQSSRTSLQVYDLTGQLVRTLVGEDLPAGRHGASWNGRDTQGRLVSSGVYLYRLEAGGFVATNRMVLIR
jgi:hypothetical protein